MATYCSRREGMPFYCVLQIGINSEARRQSKRHHQQAHCITHTMMAQLVPCAATATSFLYVEHNSVVCCCRKTLALQRLFGRHSDPVTLLVPNCTMELVVSCDSKTAIVWNPESGEEINRISFPERITAAAWMGNGNVVLG